MYSIPISFPADNSNKVFDMMSLTRRSALKTVAVSTASIAIPTLAQARLGRLNQAIHLGVIADVHIGLAAGAEKRLDAFVNEMKKQNNHALIQLGDFAFPNKKYQTTADQFNAAHQVALHAIGNHDLDHGLRKQDCLNAWKIPSAYYARDVGGLRILVLDGNDKGSPKHRGGYPCYIGPTQVKWLADQLQAADQPILIASHQALAGVGSVDNAKELQELLARHADKIVLCINGHSHVDALLHIKGISYLHINSASYFWVGGRLRMAHYREPLFARITIDPQTSAIRVAGRQTTWSGKNPDDIDYFQGKDPQLRKIVVPKISNRKFSTG